MPSVLIVCAHRPRRSPSQRYRFEQYLPFLEQQGFTFTWSYLLNEKNDKVFYSAGNFFAKAFILFRSLLVRLSDCLRVKNFDIVLIQREASFFGTSFFEKRAYRSGTHVIFDFDDSIWLADTSPGNKKWEFMKKPGKFYKNLGYAHTVIAGNEYLAQKALPFNKNTHIIPTTVDSQVHVPKPGLRNKEFITIGWSGSISTVKHFEALAPVLIRLKERYPGKLRFKVLGSAQYVNPQLEVEAKAWSEATEVDELNSFDIGIMPLPDDEWANGKCGLKGLSYMACGVCTVMSEVGVNKKIIRHGANGMLAENDYEWFVLLCELVENRVLRQTLGAAGRKTVEERYSVQTNKEKYLKIFQDAKPR